MPTGLQISTEYIQRVLWPLLVRELPQQHKRLAVAVVGTGSDVLGLDDDISRDHHWGPRANVMVLPEDAETLIPEVRRVLQAGLSRQYEQYEVHLDIKALSGVCCCSIDDFMKYFLGTCKLPASDLEWLGLCEVDLFHVTAGSVVVDEAGELTRRRKILGQYPDDVWKKRLADWCMYITGRDAPYNLNRMARRGDTFTGAIYEALYFRQAMELCFTLNRRYAPYTKWLSRTVRELPRWGGEVAGRLEEIHAEPDLHAKVLKMIDVNYVIADALAELGLTEEVRRRPFDPGLSDLTLYDSAWQIYRTLPQDLLAPSFNRTELWERLAREVLFDAEDYFQKKYEAAHTK